ncbi:MAG: HD domain-containing protein [Spirochaetota bacterium]|nr:HD domain-containing protein [Spirochaetota bacterium]
MATYPAQFEEKIIESSILFAKERMKNLRPSHGWDHVQRVLSLSKKIALIEKADFFIIEVSTILHDIAREIEDNTGGDLCHAELGSRIAYDFLLKEGLDEDRAKKITHCIKTHRFRNNETPNSIEAKILYDADKLDSIGAIGIGRAFLFSGEIGARLHNSDIDILTTTAYTEEDTAYREYIVKLQYIIQNMLTDEGRRLAQGRHNFMTIFFNRLKAEVSCIE